MKKANLVNQHQPFIKIPSLFFFSQQPNTNSFMTMTRFELLSDLAGKSFDYGTTITVILS